MHAGYNFMPQSPPELYHRGEVRDNKISSSLANKL